MLEWLKQLLGIEKLPQDMQAIYTQVKDERELLRLLRNARYKDEQKILLYAEDIEILEQKEKELLQQGKAEAEEFKKLKYASEIKIIRGRKISIQQKKAICEKRVEILNTHIGLLETLVEALREGLPTKEQMEELALKTKTTLEELDEIMDTASALKPKYEHIIDKETEDIIKELTPQKEQAQAEEAPPPEPEKKLREFDKKEILEE